MGGHAHGEVASAVAVEAVMELEKRLVHRPQRRRPHRRARYRARRGGRLGSPTSPRTTRSCAAPARRSWPSWRMAPASASRTSATRVPTCSATVRSSDSPATTRSCRASSTRAASPSRRRRPIRDVRGSCARCRTAAKPSPTCSSTTPPSATATSSAPTASPPSSTTRWWPRCCVPRPTARAASWSRFVRLANAGGGPDNITCIVADLVDAPAVDGEAVVVGAAASDGEPA